MAGPYHHPHYIPSFDEDGDAAPHHRYNHYDSQQDHHGRLEEEEADGQEAIDDHSESAPFYNHNNSSYYTRNRNNSEASLPLYRSRSHSLSTAAANNNSFTMSNSAVPPPAMPEGAAALSSSSIRAVDYTQTDSANHVHDPRQKHQRPDMPERAVVNTTSSSNGSHNSNSSSSNNNTAYDNSQSTTWSSNANTLTNSTSTQHHSALHAHQQQQQHEKKKMTWADEVARVFDPSTGTARPYHSHDEKEETEYLNDVNALKNSGSGGQAIHRSASPLSFSNNANITNDIKAPTMSRRETENDMEDDQNGFDDYDWDDDDELVKQLDEKYEEEYKKNSNNGGALSGDQRLRSTVIRKFSPVHLAKLLLFTFLGNLIIVLLLITPALVVQFLVKGKTQDEHLQFVCDNIEAWCYWIAFNFIAKWIIHSLFDLIPKLFVFMVELIWGDLNEKFIGYVELFNASAPYIKPLFFAGFFWGSFAVTFNSIFHLRNASDPSNSRAPYTYRIYQVVELLFFIALIWSIEKILIRYISLNFHAVAFADRLKNNAFALSTIDTLKSYRPKKAYRRTGGGGHSGFNTPSAFSRVGFGGTSDGYFSSPNIGRSRASTPPFGNGSPAQQQQGQVTSPIASITPGAPEPSHQSLWSRLPIPPTFRGHNSTHHQNLPSQDNAIPLQVTSQHFSSSADNRRTAPGHPSYSTQSSQHNPLSSSQPESANASVPTTPGTGTGTGNAAITSSSANRNTKAQGKKNKKQKALHLFGKKAATAQEIARQAMVDPLKTLNNPNIVGKGLGLDFGGAKDAKKLARDLFYAFRSDTSRNYLITSDFYPAFKTESEAEAAFAVFDKDGNGDISRPEIRATILAAYKERKFLARSLQDVSEAVSTLDRLFQVAALIILALISFAIFKVNIYSNLTTAYTIAIAASFIFKSAAQNVFDSVIFLFATHPFDSGDRIFLESEVYVVKQLGLFSTLFTKWDGTETMIANSKLGTLTITNLRRSPPQFENATLQVGWNTSLEQLDELEKKMNNWLQKDEKRMFAPSTAVVLQNFNYMRWIEITIGMLHRENWQDWGERWNRRTAFHAALLHYCKEIGITFVNSPQPVQYWQEDLEKPYVEDDMDDLDDMRSPLSPADGENQIPAPASVQPLMGFLPPEGSTMRRRKGFSKSKNMAGVGA